MRRALAVLLAVASSGAAAEALRYMLEFPPVVFDPPPEPIRCVCACRPATLADFGPELVVAYALFVSAVGGLGFVAGRVKRIRARIK